MSDQYVVHKVLSHSLPFPAFFPPYLYEVWIKGKE